ncbi:hypothetical protein AKJ37_02290 [candidate division MSBL1 archaeon SCGC-AAA259I09]|uniref:Uncharacterized protein n=2 Tax=candidate division MSBL1 TaxID=215777 RepID=A0A133UP74_9EURY|nr:hypothetical protein AKJ38_04065 [candidate division MSBL1 archaeon SCGC-AAA259I14]KXA97805.1 hypothetical protein AKJ37_02290 [candidate division MSBL1 archaeon SCGC-AAA259I09]
MFDNPSARKSRRRFENKIQKFLKDKHRENKKHLKKGFVPSTNNVMEQIFSFISDFTYQAKSFKTKSGLKNWAANMFNNWNHRKINTGKHFGLPPSTSPAKKDHQQKSRDKTPKTPCPPPSLKTLQNILLYSKTILPAHKNNSSTPINES